MWLVLIYVSPLSYSMMGKADYASLKSIRDLDTWGPAVTWASPFQVQKSKNNPFSSQIFSCLEEATATTTTQAPSTCHASQPLRVTSFSEHLENLTNDPRKEPFTLYVSA